VDALSTVGSDVVSAVVAMQTAGSTNPGELNYVNLAPRKNRPKRFLSDDGYDHVDPPDQVLPGNSPGIVENISEIGRTLGAYELETSIDTVASSCNLLQSENMDNRETKSSHPIYAALEDDSNGEPADDANLERRPEGHEEIVTNSVPGDSSQQNSSGHEVSAIYENSVPESTSQQNSNGNTISSKTMVLPLYENSLPGNASEQTNNANGGPPKKEAFSLYEAIEDRTDTVMDSSNQQEIISPTSPSGIYQ
jgi:hypothetical protein